jgi:hypothetical protein
MLRLGRYMNYLDKILGYVLGVSFCLLVLRMVSMDQTSSLYILLQTAACLRMLGELREAAEVYEHGRFILQARWLFSDAYMFPNSNPCGSKPQRFKDEVG